jgi:3-hydroxy-3-methylglutaryl CoA synthase
MPVILTEYAKIKSTDGAEREGKAVANNLVAIEEDGEIYYGKLINVTHVRSKIICDNDKCSNSEVGEDFVSHPRTFEFEDNGDNSPDFMQKINDVVIVANYLGEKMCFCTPECSAAYFKRVSRENAEKKIASISSGKGTKTQFAETPLGESLGG